ncbi:SulP family inorganic anion transporter [Stappia sp. F7233]|uniref:SulP family inorganic anion transporter n=1 Tax=Stappia albiluteola TaxID=2758565 RepID=A0A839AEN7_9HYPH|nr:SulP family inorganic anion transporter [Stappia albiluteola]MBA5777586.1 SulP family inorganic anion transporter [Stappia albiluteola]
MDASSANRGHSHEPGFRELFTPKLITTLARGYRLGDFRADAIAGLTVAIVALPLSMAIAIASGVSPDRGLITAIVGGFFVSALGGSRFQIGGPAGAFIVLVAATVQRHGIEGLVLATMMSGIFLLVIGFLRLGTYIKFIPYPVTVGFTAGIAIIIFASQVKELFGLTLATPEPGPILEKIPVLVDALPSVNAASVVVAASTIVIILGLKRLRPNWPGMLIAVAALSVAAAIFGLPLETIGTRFGGIPSGLPVPSLPEISLERLHAVLPDAIAFTLLGAIESLLSAVVADGMTGRRHRSNSELVGQGVANIASALFGGICVTGTIARTATNVRAGGRTPVAGMMHAAFLLLFILAAAPLLSYVPLAALAGVLALVAWNMIEKHAIRALLGGERGDALVLIVTLTLTVFADLTEAIVVGFLLGSVLFIDRLAKTIAIEHHMDFVPEDVADTTNGQRKPYDPALAADPDLVVYRISGPVFFGAASTVGSILDRIADQHKAFVLDFRSVPFLDSTAANTVAGAARKAAARGVRLFVTGAQPHIRHELHLHGVRPPQVRFLPSIDKAVAIVRRREGGEAG